MISFFYPYTDAFSTVVYTYPSDIRTRPRTDVGGGGGLLRQPPPNNNNRRISSDVDFPKDRQCPNGAEHSMYSAVRRPHMQKEITWMGLCMERDAILQLHIFEACPSESLDAPIPCCVARLTCNDVWVISDRS